ncbi:DUF1120 domain-containing protein [Pseudomonas sp. QLc11A]|jgi:hypothetical protein|uniref:DUF1120 domain-containing protein n=1 Tax=Pseudomonas azerbaijanorientalis TaxID=2842350 RepID=A0ABW8VZB4_9PSED
MKKYFAALATTAVISTAPQAFAVDNTLEVKGIITPVACTPVFSNNGTIELGKISSKELNPDTHKKIRENNIQLVVTCSAPQSFSLNPIDNRRETSTGDWFGLGLTTNLEKLGYFYPAIVSVNDGATPLDPIDSTDEENWSKATSAKPGRYLSVAAIGDTSPIKAENVTFDFRVDTYIAPANGLTLDQDVTIDGSATFDLAYY